MILRLFAYGSLHFNSCSLLLNLEDFFHPLLNRVCKHFPGTRERLRGWECVCTAALPEGPGLPAPMLGAQNHPEVELPEIWHPFQDPVSPCTQISGTHIHKWLDKNKSLWKGTHSPRLWLIRGIFLTGHKVSTRQEQCFYFDKTGFWVFPLRKWAFSSVPTLCSARDLTEFCSSMFSVRLIFLHYVHKLAGHPELTFIHSLRFGWEFNVLWGTGRKSTLPLTVWQLWHRLFEQICIGLFLGFCLGHWLTCLFLLWHHAVLTAWLCAASLSGEACPFPYSSPHWSVSSLAYGRQNWQGPPGLHSEFETIIHRRVRLCHISYTTPKT